MGITPGVLFFFSFFFILTQVLFFRKKWIPSRFTAASAVMQTGLLARRLASPPFPRQCQPHRRPSCHARQRRGWGGFYHRRQLTHGVCEWREGHQALYTLPLPPLLHAGGGGGGLASLLRSGRELGWCLAQASCAKGVVLFCEKIRPWRGE